MDELSVTEMLNAAQGGNPAAWNKAIEALYGELRRISACHMRLERHGHLLQPTALLHEVWLKLHKAPGMSFESRIHFLSTCSRMMRQVLIDHSRRSSPCSFLPARQGEPDLCALHEALRELERLCPRQYRTVELRYFGGLMLEEIAAATHVSIRTVKRDWAAARAWLHCYLAGRAL